jgi:hypothetical protein
MFLPACLAFLSLVPLVCRTSGLMLIVFLLVIAVPISAIILVVFPDVLCAGFNKLLRKTAASVRSASISFDWSGGLGITLKVNDFQISSPVCLLLILKFQLDGYSDVCTLFSIGCSLASSKRKS